VLRYSTMRISRLLPLLFAGGVLAIAEAKAPFYFDLSGTFGSSGNDTGSAINFLERVG